MSQTPSLASALAMQVAQIANRSSATEVLELLAMPRVAVYKDHFKPKSDDEHLGSYLWAQAVSASLHPFIGWSEVVLRNAIHASLSVQCSRGASDSSAWYDRASKDAVPLNGKSLEKIEALLCTGTPPVRKAIQPSPDLVVSELSFGFWPNVMEGLSQRFAPRTFTDVFPHHPNSKPAHWSRPTNKESVVLRFKRLQDIRNRVCHFEPVWKPHWLGCSAASWSHSVKGLRDLHTDLLELLNWCSPRAVTAYKQSYSWNWFNSLCTTNAVKAFMADHEATAKLPSFGLQQAVTTPAATQPVTASQP